MSNQLRNRKKIASTIRNDLHSSLKEIANETEIPISKLLDKAIELLINDMKQKGLYTPQK